MKTIEELQTELVQKQVTLGNWKSSISNYELLMQKVQREIDTLKKKIKNQQNQDIDDYELCKAVTKAAEWEYINLGGVGDGYQDIDGNVVAVCPFDPATCKADIARVWISNPPKNSLYVLNMASKNLYITVNYGEQIYNSPKKMSQLYVQLKGTEK